MAFEPSTKAFSGKRDVHLKPVLPVQHSRRRGNRSGR